MICVHLNELQYFIFKRRSQSGATKLSKRFFSLIFLAALAGMSGPKTFQPAVVYGIVIVIKVACQPSVYTHPLPGHSLALIQPLQLLWHTGKLPNCFTPSPGQADRAVHVFNSFVLKLNQSKCEVLQLQRQHAPATAAPAPRRCGRQEVVIAQLITHIRRLQAELDYCG